MCCHPALDPAVRVALTLRSVCGLSTGQIAAGFLVPEATMAQRLVRAKRKIRQAGIPMLVPSGPELGGRLSSVLRVIYLVFTEGHMATGGSLLVRGDLCDEAIRLARVIRELLLVEQALRLRQPGPYQLHAAIAACHGEAGSAADTGWRQILALYDELLRFEPTAVVAANRAAAVAMADGPEAGLAILAELGSDPAVARWPQLHVATAELLHRAGDADAALAAYRQALRPGVADAQRAFVERRIRALEAESGESDEPGEPGE